MLTRQPAGSGEASDAQGALDAGLVREVLELENLLPPARELEREIAE